MSAAAASGANIGTDAAASAKEDELTAYITSHVVDNVVFTILSERGLGPSLYGVFPEGR